MFKDDNLFISYTKEIDKSKEVIKLICEKEIYHADGFNIVKMLKAIRKYSNYDISSIVEQIKDKCNWFRSAYPKDFESECGDWDIDKALGEK